MQILDPVIEIESKANMLLFSIHLYKVYPSKL